jgi:hypothetical protein
MTMLLMLFAGRILPLMRAFDILGVGHRIGIDYVQYFRRPAEHLSTAGTIAVTFSGSGIENRNA